MYKRIFLCIVMLLTLVATTSVAFAEEPTTQPSEYTYNVEKDSHKVKNKWDLSGTFVAYPGYNWGGLAEGATWNYSVHIKEAMSGEYSVGSIHFWTGDIDVVGHVKATKENYGYDGWASGDNIAAVGTTTYNDTTYYFMFLYAERAVWFALSTTPYDTPWADQNVWAKSLRAYEVHSLVTNEFPLDYKVIH
jgi:hypothetical protein